MSEIKKDANYWSQYDFTQIPYDDLVKVGQRTETCFPYHGYWDVSVITSVLIVGLMLEATEKTIDRQSCV